MIEKLEKRAAEKTEKENKISRQKVEFRGTSKSKMKVSKRGRPGSFNPQRKWVRRIFSQSDSDTIWLICCWMM